MDSNKKTFNYSVLFVGVYIVLAILILLWIWLPKNIKQSNVALKYNNIDSNQKAIDMYTIKLKKLLSKGDLEELYNKLDSNYISSNNLNKDNYISFLENKGYISEKIEIISSTVNIQENEIYVYRFLYSNGMENKYVNVIEIKPYEYSLSFEQDTLPNVNKEEENNNNNLEISESSSDKVTVLNNVKYSVSKKSIRDNGITYTLKITNNSEDEIRYKFDNITNVSVVLEDGKEAFMGGTVMTSDEDNLSVSGYLEKDLFFAVSSSDQNKIKYIKIRNVRYGDNKTTVYIGV